MKDLTRRKIQEAIDDIKRLGGLKDSGMTEVINKLKKILADEEKSNK